MPTQWSSIAPVSTRYVDSLKDLPRNFNFDLGTGIKLRPPPAWLLTIDKTSGIQDNDRDLRRASFAFIIESEEPFSWAWEEEENELEKREERISLANFALWIARPSRVGFHTILHANRETENNAWVIKRWTTNHPQLKPFEQDLGNILSESDIHVARTFHQALTQLSRKGAIWVASRLFWKVLTESMWEVRYVLLWFALETLFGPSDPHETTYLLSQRIAFFLAKNKEETKGLFSSVKKGYGWRSKIVHGSRIDKLSEEQSQQMLCQAGFFLREGLCKILSDPQLIGIFSAEKQRESYLQDLIFS